MCAYMQHVDTHMHTYMCTCYKMCVLGNVHTCI